MKPVLRRQPRERHFCSIDIGLHYKLLVTDLAKFHLALLFNIGPILACGLRQSEVFNYNFVNFQDILLKFS